MEANKQKALIVKEFGKPLVFDQWEILEPQKGQVKIKVLASPINPSDRIMSRGSYWRTTPGFVGGLQGCGQVIKVGSQQDNHLLGKRVSFNTNNGAWAQYTVANTSNCWVVDNDVPLQCAASGVINPITVIGFIQTYKKCNNRGSTGKGIINSAASSALGRMLSRYCQKLNIPLLNIVRRKQQVQVLQKQGAQHIISTSDQNWVQQYKQAIQKHGFNILFDAIGGGDVSDKLISNLPPLGQAFVYGKLCSDNLVVSKPMIFSGGFLVTSWLIFEWLPTISKQQKQYIVDNLSSLLKKQLSTTSVKQLKLNQVADFFNESQDKATQGKYTIIL